MGRATMKHQGSGSESRSQDTCSSRVHLEVVQGEGFGALRTIPQNMISAFWLFPVFVLRFLGAATTMHMGTDIRSQCLIF